MQTAHRNKLSAEPYHWPLGPLDQAESGASMMSRYGNTKRGFTVIELMIVLIIVAILVALAYPSYVDYVRKARRGEAQQLLLNWSINQEIWRSNNATYATTGQLPAPTHDGGKYYLFDFAVAPTGTTYTLRAAAQNDQVKDKLKGTAGFCTPLTLTQAGVKAPPGCWQ